MVLFANIQYTVSLPETMGLFLWKEKSPFNQPVDSGCFLNHSNRSKSQIHSPQKKIFRSETAIFGKKEAEFLQIPSKYIKILYKSRFTFPPRHPRLFFGDPLASFAAFALASALALAGAAFAGPLELLAASAMVEGVGPEISRGNSRQQVWKS